MTYLAVKCKVAASTQNQAFNSLLKVVDELHDRDLADGYDGVFLGDAVEKKFLRRFR